MSSPATRAASSMCESAKGASSFGRLPDHRRNPALKFVTDIYVLTTKKLTKGHVLYLQERMTDIVLQANVAKLVAGCGPQRDFPLRRRQKAAMEDLLRYALPTFWTAGCKAFGRHHLSQSASDDFE